MFQQLAFSHGVDPNIFDTLVTQLTGKRLEKTMETQLMCFVNIV